MAAMAQDHFHHVRDTAKWELPRFVHELMGTDEHYNLPFGLTKYMVLQVVVVVLVLLIFRGLSNRIRGGKPVRGVWWNFWEMLALYIRDEVVRPSIGYPHHGDDAHGGGDEHADHAHPHVTPLISGHGAEPVVVGHPADKYLPYV